ncbi:MBL fold metallo-hydrolase [Tumebacillus permanentifrigoris]|uniref:MBL fold metallo-hydrolase n=1 Tax=Tumebacillus permanentifrigoris TaxID=378543 RepID=UPI000D6D85F1|nr:MBL fold metallo-hydrolase [Tumebacillus permanentifrigoris]
MRFSVLASGSTGNAIYVETEETAVLIDAGVSGKQITNALAEIGADAKKISALLVTHEHSDHVRGVGVMSRKQDLDVYATSGTWEGMEKYVGDINVEKQHTFTVGESLCFGDLKIEPFPISHDAREPVGFCFYQGETKLALATDLGYVSTRVRDAIAGADAFIFESNHDVEMLRIGPHPWTVKKRILGDKGHLSNETAGDTLTEVLSGNSQDVYLAHLSPDNNMPEIAEITVRGILTENGFNVGQDVVLHDTYRDKPTPMQTIKRM